MEASKKSLSVRSTITILGIAGLVIVCIAAWKSGLFSTREQLQQTLQHFGVFAALLFAALQAVQVVIPIMPGGIGCFVGVVMFGAFKGFLLNYIGICIGSAAAFLLARKCGMPLLSRMFSPKLLNRYLSFTGEKNRFTKFFAIAIFLPVAPDDFLCYLAGTTTMRFSVFLLIILLGKIPAIALYSLGLVQLFDHFLPMILGRKFW